MPVLELHDRVVVVMEDNSLRSGVVQALNSSKAAPHRGKPIGEVGSVKSYTYEVETKIPGGTQRVHALAKHVLLEAGLLAVGNIIALTAAAGGGGQPSDADVEMHTDDEVEAAEAAAAAVAAEAAAEVVVEAVSKAAHT